MKEQGSREGEGKVGRGCDRERRGERVRRKGWGGRERRARKVGVR